MNINKEQAMDFLTNIDESDKVMLIFHDDLDGISSGILMSDYLDNLGVKYKKMIFSYGKTIEKVKEEVKDCNKIIFMDLAPVAVIRIFPALENKKIISIDHHPEDLKLSDSVLNYRSQEYTPASRMVFELIGGKEWLAVCGVLGDVGDKYEINSDFINDFINKSRFSLEDFKNKFVYKLMSFLVYFDDKYEEAFNILKKIKTLEEIKKIEKYSNPVKKEVKKFEKLFWEKKKKIGEITYFYFEPGFDIKTMLINKISSESFNGILIFISPTKENMNVSARNQSREYNVADILKKLISGFEKAGAGGHFSASGGYFEKKDLKKFEDNLRKLKL